MSGAWTRKTAAVEVVVVVVEVLGRSYGFGVLDWWVVTLVEV